MLVMDCEVVMALQRQDVPHQYSHRTKIGKTLAMRIKALSVPLKNPRPVAEAISTAGGVALQAMGPDLMLSARPHVYCAGEMLDWEAPTGGYLLTACLASGLWAARGILSNSFTN